MDGGERRERTGSWLVVPRRLFAGTAARVVTGEEEGAATLIVEVGGLQLRLGREDELEGAVGVGARGRDVETEDGGDVVGGEDAVVLRAERLVRFRLGDLGDVVRELELARGESSWAGVSLGQGALSQDFSWVGGDHTGEYGEGSERSRLHFDIMEAILLLYKEASDCNERANE